MTNPHICDRCGKILVMLFPVGILIGLYLWHESTTTLLFRASGKILIGWAILCLIVGTIMLRKARKIWEQIAADTQKNTLEGDLR